MKSSNNGIELVVDGEMALHDCNQKFYAYAIEKLKDRQVDIFKGIQKDDDTVVLIFDLVHWHNKNIIVRNLYPEKNDDNDDWVTNGDSLMK